MAEVKKTKGKKMAEVTEVKEVTFDDLELTIAKPVLSADKSVSISGNFSELGTKIQALVDRYKGTELTEDNVSYVKTLKGHFVSLRTGIERERKEYKKVYIEPASKLLDSMCAELQKIVAEGEDALGKQLDAYDQKRKDELTVVLKDYIAGAVSKHGLREEYAEQIVLKKEYYNKTQAEEDSADDIEAQAVELEKKQKEYDSGVLLIKAECEEADFLPDSYIRELQYKGVSEILLEIKADKKTKAEIAEEACPVIGEPETSELEAELKKAEAVSTKESREETRTRVLKVTYKVEQAKLMAKFFKENKIAFEFVN